MKGKADMTPGAPKDSPSPSPPRVAGPQDPGSLRGIGPSLPYPVKATVTRARSAAWYARSRGHTWLSGLRILFYHRVSDARDELAVHPRRFREQMDYLAAAGYQVLDIVQIADLLEAGELPERAVGLNFDDGYLDVAEHALPVLAQHGFRATVFVATGVTDGRASFGWYEHQPPLLGWEDIAELDGGGTLEFEAHTVTHPNLLAVDDRRAAAEIERLEAGARGPSRPSGNGPLVPGRAFRTARAAARNDRGISSRRLV